MPLFWEDGDGLNGETLRQLRQMELQPLNYMVVSSPCGPIHLSPSRRQRPLSINEVGLKYSYLFETDVLGVVLALDDKTGCIECTPIKLWPGWTIKSFLIGFLPQHSSVVNFKKNNLCYHTFVLSAVAAVWLT